MSTVQPPSSETPTDEPQPATVTIPVVTRDQMYALRAIRDTWVRPQGYESGKWKPVSNMRNARMVKEVVEDVITQGWAQVDTRQATRRGPLVRLTPLGRLIAAS